MNMSFIAFTDFTVSKLNNTEDTVCDAVMKARPLQEFHYVVVDTIIADQL